MKPTEGTLISTSKRKSPLHVRSPRGSLTSPVGAKYAFRLSSSLGSSTGFLSSPGGVRSMDRDVLDHTQWCERHYRRQCTERNKRGGKAAAGSFSSPFKATEQNCLKGDGWRELEEQRIESIQNTLHVMANGGCNSFIPQ